MTNIHKLFARLSTLPLARKEELRRKYDQGSLTAVEKDELKDHIIRAMVRLQDEAELAKTLMEAL